MVVVRQSYIKMYGKGYPTKNSISDKSNRVNSIFRIMHSLCLVCVALVIIVKKII